MANITKCALGVKGTDVKHFPLGTCCRIRMHAIPKLKTVDRWTEKRSMFGVYDNIGILGMISWNYLEFWFRGTTVHNVMS